MPLIPSHRAQKTEHEGLTSLSAPDWDNIRIFLAVARASSFRTAAQKLAMTGHAIGRRISQLERQLNVVLFTRHRDGVRLTEDGQKLLSAALAMEEASLEIIRGRGTVAQPFHGEVRVAATEGLGTFWLTPRLIEFVRAHPKILVDLHCSMQCPDELVLRARADLAIQIEHPVRRELVVRKIGRMHVVLCASREYLKTYGTPSSLRDMTDNHRLVMQYANQGRANEHYNAMFGSYPQIGFMAMRTDVSTAMYAAVLGGLAAGWLPTYYFAMGTRVIPLDIGPRVHFDIWLSYHPDTGKLARVRRIIDWAIETFDPQNNPWFRDDFIRPQEFRKHQPLVSPVPITIDAFFGHIDNVR
jgi:DNA-binding transcriptional LysR family regulator